MGLFDFLNRKPARPPEDDGPSPDYAFAHDALRQIALSDPLGFLAIATSPDAERFIDAVLQDVAEHCGRKTSFDAESIKIHRTNVNSFPCAVLEFPEPQEMAEAFMIAVVVPMEKTSGSQAESTIIAGRYFTLEKGFTMSNEPRTVLAEWDSKQHSNYGDGPAPHVDEFVKALSKYL